MRPAALILAWAVVVRSGEFSHGFCTPPRCASCLRTPCLYDTFAHLRVSTTDCRYDLLVIPNGARASGTNCGSAGEVSDPGSCRVIYDGHTCGDALCAGSWNTPVCIAGSPGSCALDAFSVPDGAALTVNAATGCSPGFSVSLGDSCTYTKVGHTCTPARCAQDFGADSYYWSGGVCSEAVIRPMIFAPHLDTSLRFLPLYTPISITNTQTAFLSPGCTLHI